MRKLYFILLILIAGPMFINGCDTGGDSVANSTTVPNLIAPPDQDTTVSLTPSFKWSGSADKLEIGTSPSFQTIVKSITLQTTDSIYTLPASDSLHHGTFYYWHAGKNSGGTEYWSTNTYTFKTVP